MKIIVFLFFVLALNVFAQEKPELILQNGHAEAIYCIAFSADCKYVLSGGHDKTMKLWEVATGKEIRTYMGHTNDVRTVCFTQDGKYAQSTSDDKTTKLWDLATGKEIKGNGNEVFVKLLSISPDGKYKIYADSYKGIYKLLVVSTDNEILDFKTGHANGASGAIFSPNGKYVLSCGYDKSLVLWDISTQKKIRFFTPHSSSVQSTAFSPDGKLLISGNLDNKLKLWDISTGKEIKVFSGHTDVVSSTVFSPDGKYVLSGSKDKTLKLWDVSSGNEIRTFTGHSEQIFSVAFSPDGKYGLSGSWDRTMKLWDISNGKEIITFNANSPDNQIFSVAFSPDGKYVVSGAWDNSIRLWEVSSGKNIRNFNGHSKAAHTVVFSPDGKYLLSGSWDASIKLWDVLSGKEIKTMQNSTAVTDVAFSSTGKYIIMGDWNGAVKIFETESGKIIKTFNGHNFAIASVAFYKNDTYILSSSWDGTIKLWNIATGEWTALSSNVGGSEWLSFTSDGYWDSSPNGGELVSMVQGMNCWNIDQFAAKNNRPDIIVERLGSEDKDLIYHYKNQYQKRIRKLGLKEEQLSSEYYIPSAKITDVKQNEKFIEIKFSLTDEKYKLKRYNVFVNDVPLFGSYGKEITGITLDLSETVELISGDNKIEISCMNEKGSESYRALTYAKYDKSAKGDLYFLGFGVSKYKNPALNLEYADKDAKDIATIFEKMKGSQFSNAFIKTFTNEEVTPDNIKKAKEFVKNAKPDDTFVLFIAGHGMHDNDKEATYYYLTHSADPKNLKNTAADFETIEDLLQGIAPRNKLFLMDACESGEIDDDVQTNYTAQAGSRGLKSRGMKTVKNTVNVSETKQSKRSYLYQKDRFIYNDLSRRSGAIVFSSSKGGEFSYERSDIQNGLFTKSIINALSSTIADKNNNGIISIDELRDFVSSDVTKTSNSLQHPTVDRDNIYQKFGFEIVK